MTTVTELNSSRKSIDPEFEEIYREYSELVYRTAKGILGTVEDAEDVLQVIFVRLLRSQLTPSAKKNLKPYLYRAAVNQSLVIIKSRRRHILTDDTTQLASPTAANDSELAENLHTRLYEAIAKLSPEDGELIILRHIHNMSDADIARMLGTSRGVIAVRLFRSRARLRKLLRGALEGKP